MRPAIEQTWSRLATADGPDPTFDPAALAGLPPPAVRWLSRTIPAGAPLRRVTELTMSGRIRLGPRWMPFTARQILRLGTGFVWMPVVGGRLLRFVGADLADPEQARMEFRLHGLLPVARASGPDTVRSAAGRLAAETVAWLPSGATPQLGARWVPGDDHQATVTVATPEGPVDITVTIADDGRLTRLWLQRWSDSTKPPALRPFGGDLDTETTTGDGVRIAAAGTVGWDHGTPQWPDGRFFEFTITSATP